MKKIKTIILAFALAAISASTALADVTLTPVAAESKWVQNAAIQETGFAGLGNNNEPLAAACYEMPTLQLQDDQHLPHTKTYAVTYSYIASQPSSSTAPSEATATEGTQQVQCSLTGFKPSKSNHITVNFSLSGEWSAYVSKIKVWARELTGKQDENSCGVDNIFTRPFDYRDPILRSGAIQLGELNTPVASGSIVCQATLLKPGHKYMLYLTANIRSAAELSAPLPAIKGSSANFTKVGGKIESVTTHLANVANVLYEGAYSYTTWTSTKRGSQYVWQQITINATAGPYTESSGMTLRTPTDETHTFSYDATRTTACADGSRVLVPVRKIMFAPGDFYSNYYRMPALTTTSNGTLLAVTDARKYHPHDIANDIDIMALRCQAGDGLVWDTPKTLLKGIARDVNGNECALDANGRVADPSTIKCSKSLGYGDAALGSSSNGRSFLFFLHGASPETAGDNTDSNTDPNNTYAGYLIGSNNGASWSTPQYVPLTTTMHKRGQFVTGGLCVPGEGEASFIANKAVGLYHISNSATASDNGSLLLIYDFKQNTWKRAIRKGQSDTYAGCLLNPSSLFNDGGTDDEAQLTYMGNNEFLYSASVEGINNSSTGSRHFLKIKIEQGTMYDAGKIFYSVEKVTNNTPTMFTTDADAAVMRWQTQTGAVKWLHTALSHANNTLLYNDGNDRTNLRLYMRDASLEGSSGNYSVTWNELFSLSDPLQCRNEVAQYSSLATLRDGSVGVLYEEAPIGIYFNPTGEYGDYIMQQIYMQLRPEDLLSDDVTHAEKPLMPVIAPKTHTYALSSFPTEFTGITITNPNWQEGGDCNHMYLTIEYEQPNGTYYSLYTETNFTGATYTCSYNHLLSALGKAGSTHQWVTGEKIRVFATAYRNASDINNTSEQNRSDQGLEVYFLSYPVREVVIFARSKSSTTIGVPTLSADARTVGPGQVITLAVGSQVRIEANQASERPYIDFDHFSIDHFNADGSYGYEGETVNALTPYYYNNAIKTVEMSGNQITFNLPPVPRGRRHLERDTPSPP